MDPLLTEAVQVVSISFRYLKKYLATPCESLSTEAVHLLEIKISQKVLQSAPSTSHPGFLTSLIHTNEPFF